VQRRSADSIRSAPLSEYRLAVAAVRYVFRDEPLQLVATESRIDPGTLRRRFAEWGITLRNSAEQRRLDRIRGRYDHSRAIRAAWEEGAYQTDRYQATRKRGDWGFPRGGSDNPFYGRRHTAETRAALSTQARARCIPSVGVYGPEWTSALREAIVQRDGGKCQVCGATTDLQVHHVDHDRSRSVPSNLLTVCSSCHLGYHGRAERVEEMRAAHVAMLAPTGVKLATGSEEC
jgi:hypothetical protein